MADEKKRILRITTVPVSLKYLLRGQFAHMSAQGFEVDIASAPGREGIEVAEAEGVDFYEIAMTRTISPWADLRSVWKTYRLIKKRKYHIVHSHTPKAGIVGMTAAWLARTPIRMHTVAGLPLMESQGFKRKLLVAVERMTYGMATRVYPNSKGLKTYIEAHILRQSKKLNIIADGSSNGINLDYFAPHAELVEKAKHIREELDIPQSDRVGVFVGRIVADKGIHELIEAFTHIEQEHPDFHLLLVGPYEQELDPVKPEAFRQINEHPRIHAVGFQTNIRPYFLAGDFLIFPSYREGFPNAVIQAAALGLPVIASDINGCNEIIEHGKNGLLVPPKTTEPVTEALLKILGDKMFFEHTKAAARPTIGEKFDQKVVWKALEAEYRKLLADV